MKKKIEYVVEGACVKCSQGSQTTTLRATTNSRIGKQLRIVDTNTTAECFDGTFGTCSRRKGEPCEMANLPKWFITNDKFVSSSGKPCVTTESFLVCTIGGGAITAVDSGQILDDLPFSSKHISSMTERKNLQREEYIRRYGKVPSEDDLNNLFFLTDLRLDGKSEILFFYQLSKSKNIYALATEYKDYYKLATTCQIASAKYTENLEAFLIEIDSKFGAEKSVEKDYFLNGIIEQAICEIYKNQEDVDKLPDKDWYKFNDIINELAHGISSVYDVDINEDRSNVSEFVHIERNAFNRAPKTWEDMLANPSGWERQIVFGSGYHMNGKDAKSNIKMYHESGSEAVYNLKTGELLLIDNDPNNMSTYNYGGQNGITPGTPHNDLDIATHKKWGVGVDVNQSEPLANVGIALMPTIIDPLYASLWDKSTKIYNQAKKDFEDAKKAIGE